MRDRVMGIENEFGIILEKAGTIRPLDPTDGSNTDISAVRGLMKSANVAGSLYTEGNGKLWFSNGSLLYIDLGFHPEYASCECRRVRDLVLYSKAGEVIAARVLGGPMPDGWRPFLFKNNLGYLPERYRRGDPLEDGIGGEMGRLSTMGCHENYLIFGFPKDSMLYQNLAPFLITRQIIDGAGWWMEDGLFLHSQRALVMDMEVGPSNPTTGRGPKRGIVTERGQTQPLVGKVFEGTMRRFQLIIGDANILEAATFLKFGTTSLVLSLIEEGLLSLPSCKKGVEAIMAVASDAGGKTPLLCFEDGSVRSAVDVQAWYLEQVKKYINSTHFESKTSKAEAEEIISLWEQALNAIEHNDTEWMLGRLDWATKRFIGEEAVKQKGATGQDAHRIRKTVDILYHGITDTRLRDRIYKRWGSRRLLRDEEIERAVATPPQDTRARIRGMLVGTLSQERFFDKCVSIDWSSINWRKRELCFGNPLDSKGVEVGFMAEDFFTLLDLIQRMPNRAEE